MTRWLVALLAVCAFAARADAQPAKLHAGQFHAGPREPEAPFIDVLTFGVGDRIFEKFGHAAICLRYHEPRTSPVCFNYGVTDFADGAGLTWGFLRGTQKFWVEPSSFGSMYGFYRAEDRDIWRQTLPLDEKQARAIEAELWSSLDEEHRFYTYDHFFDNCTTRLRDMIERVTGKMSPGGDEPYPLTFRQLGYRGLSELPVLVALTDFVVGRQADDHPTVWQAMFHPDIFRAELEARFGVVPERIYARTGHAFPPSGPTGRLEMLALAVLVALPLVAARFRRRRIVHGGRLAIRPQHALVATILAFCGVLAFLLYAIQSAGQTAGMVAAIALAVPMALASAFRRGDVVAVAWAAFYLALWGTIIWSLVILSAIPGIRWNEVVFVLMPFDAILPFLGGVRRQRYARFRIAGLALVSLLAAIGVFHQPLWIPILTAFVPLALIAMPTDES